MKKIYIAVSLIILGITQMFAQINCFDCNSTTKSFRIGANTGANGQNSFAGGNYSTVSSLNGFVFGDHSSVDGSNGIALGNTAIVDSANGIAIGNFVKSTAANSYVFGMGSSNSRLTNSKPNSIMFGVSNKPTLTIFKPQGADRGYLGIGTDDPKEQVHVIGKLLIERTDDMPSSLQFKHPKTRGVGPGGGDPQVLRCDIYSDTKGLHFYAEETNGVLNSYSQKMILGYQGNVGIGPRITTPLARLHVDQDIIGEGDITAFNKFVLAPDNNVNSQRWEISRTNEGLNYAYCYKKSQDILFVGKNGNIGIGQTVPSAMLDVNGSFKAQSASINGGLSAQNTTITGNATITGTLSAPTISGNTTVTGTLSAPTISGNTYFSGNVGIGVNPTDKVKLEVAGTIRSHEVKVCLDQGCDYVFNEDYNLMSLKDLNHFVKANKHLPDVAPAAEMEAEGINLSEMNALLLRKIEELTLYILDLQTQINDLKNQ